MHYSNTNTYLIEWEKEKNRAFIPVRNDKVRKISIEEGAAVLSEIGLNGGIRPEPKQLSSVPMRCAGDGKINLKIIEPCMEIQCFYTIILIRKQVRFGICRI